MKLHPEEIKEIIKEKVSSRVIPEHNELGHFYRDNLDNRLYASVTAKCGILDMPHLKRWSAKLAVEHIQKHISEILRSGSLTEELSRAAILAHQQEFEESGYIGNKGHETIDKYFKQWLSSGVQPDDIKTFIEGDDSRLWAIPRSAERFFKEHEVIPLASELKVVSQKYRYGGTLDCLAMVDGKFVLLDYKTSNSIDKPEYAMQPSAYWWALNEMTRTDPKKMGTGLMPEVTYVVQLDKAVARYRIVKLTNRAQSFKAFRNASKVYDWLENQQEKLSPLVPKQTVQL